MGRRENGMPIPNSDKCSGTDEFDSAVGAMANITSERNCVFTDPRGDVDAQRLRYVSKLHRFAR